VFSIVHVGCMLLVLTNLKNIFLVIVLTAQNMGVDRTKLPIGCKRHLYHLQVKKAIVDEAFSSPRNLRATARKFSVQPTQICIWKRKFEGAPGAGSNLEIITTTTTASNDSKTLSKRIKKCTGSRFGGGGRKPLLSKDVIQQLKEYYDGKGDEDLGVTLRLMMA
jgi:transposase-like protein